MKFFFLFIIPCALLSQTRNVTPTQTVQQTSTITNPVQTNIEPAKTFSNTMGIDFILVEPRMFSMGSDSKESSSKPPHRVRISKSFYIGKFEVTQKQWISVMSNNPSAIKVPNHPVSMISWNDTQEFIKKLNEKENTKKYRLPTEAEWEFAARGGKLGLGDNHVYSGSDDINDVAVYKDNSLEDSKPVGSMKPNELDVHDMSGNVWEWVNDWYDASFYQNSPDVDPSGPRYGDERVLRGGSWSSSISNCTITRRYKEKPDAKFIIFGFRLIMDVD